MYIFVPDTPSFVISRVPGFGIPLREGIPVSLKCDVESNPPSKPVWLKGLCYYGKYLFSLFCFFFIYISTLYTDL